jgi:hypothetical protein
MKLPSFHFSERGLRAFAIALCAIVGLAVLAGLYVAGTPGNQRVRRLDQTRVDDLRSLRYAVDNFYADRKAVPERLEDLSDPRYGAYRTVDPETGAPYEYVRTDATHFQLCATFATDSAAVTDPRKPVPGIPDEDFAHGVGRTCFTFNALTSQLSGCGPSWSCGAGQECVSLPEVGQRCVPAGTACAAAGCASDKCIVAESFPPQVRCAVSATDTPPAPGQTPGDISNSCVLMTDGKSGKVGCYGCANGNCSSAPSGWQPYVPKQGSIGIPYACYASKSGCEMAQ